MAYCGKPHETDTELNKLLTRHSLVLVTGWYGALQVLQKSGGVLRPAPCGPEFKLELSVRISICMNAYLYIKILSLPIKLKEKPVFPSFYFLLKICRNCLVMSIPSAKTEPLKYCFP